MRVSTTYLHTQGVRNILEQQAKLIDAQNQASQGVKITSPSEDPGAFARIMSLDEVIAQMTQYEENSNYATQRLNLEDSTLESVTNVLIRVKELSVQAANIGTYGGDEQRIIAGEMREKLQELLGYANTRDASGEYVFSGFQSAVEAFTRDANGNYIYNGDQGHLDLQIANNRRVMTNDSGSDIFQMIRTGNGEFAVDANSTNGGTAKISTGSVITPSLFQPEDFSIVFSENQPTPGSYAIDVSALASFDFTAEQVSFDVDATTVTLNSNVTDAAGLASAISTALGTTNYSVTENAGVITIADTTPGANSTAPVISNYNGDVDGNGVPAVAAVYTATNNIPVSFDFSTDQVSFDVAVNGGAAQTVLLNTDTVDQTGFLLAINGQLTGATASVVGTQLVITSNTPGGTSAVAVTNYNGDVDVGGATIADFATGAETTPGAVATGITADFISTGVSTIGTDATTDPSSFQYNVINDTTGATVLANQVYTDGGTIAFNGMQVAVSGDPVDGDVFTVEASRNQDVFTTMTNLIASMESPGSDDVRGIIGGDFINNGFDVGDVIDFNMQFNDQLIPINFTVATADNAAIASQIFTQIAAVAAPANPDGSVTIAGTTPGTDITFRLDAAGSAVEFISSGGVTNIPNAFSITNLRDSVANDATLSLTASGNTITSTATGSVAATATNGVAVRTDITAGLDLSLALAPARTFSLEVNGVIQNIVVPAADYTVVGVGDGTSAALLAAINAEINTAFGSQVATATESAVGGLALTTAATGQGTTIAVAEAAGPTTGAVALFGAVIGQISVGATASGASFLSGKPHRVYLSQQIDNALNNLSRAFDNVTNIQTSIGGRLNSIESQLDNNAAKKEQLQAIRSDIQDLDMAEAISNITFQTSVLQIAQQTFVKIQNLSLFNFI